MIDEVKYWKTRCLIAECGIFKLSEVWILEMMRCLGITREDLMEKYEMDKYKEYNS